MIAQLVIGFVSGILVGIAIFSNPFSRAVVIGLVAGIIVGAVAIDDVDGYIRWASNVPVATERFTAFYLSFFVGLISGSRIWAMRQMP